MLHSYSGGEGIVSSDMEITRKQFGLNILGDSFELLPNALIVQGKPTNEEYEEAFRRLSFIESAQSWWWGDLALAREKDYPEDNPRGKFKYGSLTELAEKYGKDYGALRECQRVASRYEVSNRFDTLGFRHHQIAAPLEDGLEWLNKAEENKWTTRQLEAEIYKAKRLALPEVKFTVIYADPPWEYEFSQSESRSIEAHYHTMAVEDICELPIPSDKNAILFLWTTSPKIPEALQVIEKWGFEYRTNMTWVKGELSEGEIKLQIGMGYYCREQHELLLIARRGDIGFPDPSNRPGSVILARRTEHSRKPETVYEIIERMYPNQHYIELFARQKRLGWTAWGLEVQSD